jgi:hypothetical protein
MDRSSLTLPLLACAGLGLAGALLGEGPRAPAAARAVDEAPRQPPSRVRIRVPEVDFPSGDRFRPPVRRSEPRPPPLPRDPAFAAAEDYVLREYVDMSGRFAALSVRLVGELRLDRASGRIAVVLRADPLLRGNEALGSTLLQAGGTWRLEGDELVVEGLDLANGLRDVFEPRGAAKRWRIERDGASTLIRAGLLTFERRSGP